MRCPGLGNPFRFLVAEIDDPGPRYGFAFVLNPGAVCL
jgi:hypothetical protein